ncbi:MAG: hypothetical protein ACXWQJ_19010, partial [Bdellovibrionota bacterium]
WEKLAPFGYQIYEVGSTFAQSGWRKNFSAIEQRNVLLLPPGKEKLIPASWSDKSIRKKYLSYS